MPNQAKIGDIGIGVCPCHLSPVVYTTVFVSGIPTVDVNGQDIAVIGTVGVATCGHPTIALTGSATVKAGGLGAHRVGDVGTNCGPYTTVSGSPNVVSGG